MTEWAVTAGALVTSVMSLVWGCKCVSGEGVLVLVVTGALWEMTLFRTW